MRLICLGLLAATATATACARDGDGDDDGEATQPNLAAAAPEELQRPTADVADDPTPVAESPIDPRSAQGAGQVVQQYFALVEARRFDEAARLWRDRAGAAAQAARFARDREVHAEIGAPGAIEGAAGSAYVDVPIRLYGRRADGAPFSRPGMVSLQRANDVPGSTAAQRLWRIRAIDLAGRATSGAPYRFVGSWASEQRLCGSTAWRFTAKSLRTPAGSVCRFAQVREVPGGYDIRARCTAEGPPANDVLRLRFAESARALLFESNVVADAGLVRCLVRDP